MTPRFYDSHSLRRLPWWGCWCRWRYYPYYFIVGMVCVRGEFGNSRLFLRWGFLLSTSCWFRLRLYGQSSRILPALSRTRPRECWRRTSSSAIPVVLRWIQSLPYFFFYFCICQQSYNYFFVWQKQLLFFFSFLQFHKACDEILLGGVGRKK